MEILLAEDQTANTVKLVINLAPKKFYFEELVDYPLEGIRNYFPLQIIYCKVRIDEAYAIWKTNRK